MRRALQAALAFAAAILVVGLATLVVLTGSTAGRERARRAALGALRGVINGEVSIGRVDGNLLDRFILHDVTISDRQGGTFLVASRIVARVAIAPLLTRRIVVTELDLVDPVITVAKAADGTWNYIRIFRSDTTASDSTLGFGSWVDLHNVDVTNGTLVVRQAVPLDERMSREVRDSVIAAARGGLARIRLERTAGGVHQVMTYREIDARLPRMIIADPDSIGMALKVARLRMRAEPLEGPPLVVRDARSDVRIASDTVAVRNLHLELPASRIHGAITYEVSSGDVGLDLTGDTLSFSDVRTLYPPLPDGGGRLTVRATIPAVDTALTDVTVTDARLSAGASRASGHLAVRLHGDSLEWRDADVRLSRLTTSLVERLLPGVDLGVSGAFSGRARFSGPQDEMQLDADGTFDPPRHEAFAVSAHGLAGTGDVVRARGLRLAARAVPVAYASELGIETPVRGTVDVDAVVNGSSATTMTGRATVQHHEHGATSVVTATGWVIPRDSSRLRVTLQLAPLSMELVQDFVPRADVTGEVRGTAEVTGTARDHVVAMALSLPAGRLGGEVRIAGPPASASYQGSLRFDSVDVRAMLPASPSTVLNGTMTVNGAGHDASDLTGRLTMIVRDAQVDSTSVSVAALSATAASSLVTVDSLRIEAPFGGARASGTFGIGNRTDGSLTYAVDLRSLRGLQRWIAAADTGSIAMRPLASHRATRGDSIRAIGVNAQEDIDSVVRRGLSFARRRQPLPANVPPPLARDSLSGAVRVDGTVRGGWRALAVAGKARIASVVYDGSEIGRGTAEFTWEGVRTPEPSVNATLAVDSVRFRGFAFDSTWTRASWHADSGTVELAVFPGDTAAYRGTAAYLLRPEEGQVTLRDVRLQFDSVRWTSTHESAIRWHGRGIEIDSLELRAADASGMGPGHILVHGEMPDRDPGRLTLQVDSARIAPWVTLLQGNLPLDGLASLRAEVSGVRAAPTVTGTAALLSPVWRDVPFPNIQSDFTYRDRQVRFRGALTRSAAPGVALARLTGEVPLDLTLADSVATRLIDGPITIDLEGDSIPLGPLRDVVKGISVLEGSARGRIGVRGTWDDARFEGDLALDIPRVGIAATGITFVGVTGRLKTVDTWLVIDSLVAHSGGTLTGSGAVLMQDLAHPVLDVRVSAREARVLDNERGQLVVNSDLAFIGPLDTVSVGGTLTVMHGVIHIPEPEEWNLINTGDPALFAVADTALLRELEVAPPSPILKNANVEVQLDVRRGTWARTRDGNVEVFGQLALSRDAGDEEMSVSGALNTDYGDYELYGRRFDVSRGSVRFTGPLDDPVLQVLARHDVRQAGRAPIDVQVTIGGTLEHPNISLASQAQPTLTQSDLISFLAFGRSSTSLLQFEGTSLEGGGMSGSSLAGSVAALATNQLAGVALGALTAELEADLMKQTTADVLNIRPAELPPGLSLGGLGTVLKGTQVEFGKYLDRNTFLVAQIRPTLAVPGAMFERRFGSRFRVRTSLETRYEATRPSLTAGVVPKVHQVLGAILLWTRSW